MTKFFIVFALSITCSSYAFSQSNRPKELTPAILSKIKAEVENQALAYRKSISKKDLSVAEIHFSVDTFKVGQITSRRMEVDYSTAGMNNTIIAQAASYDKLLNKYYKMLLATLKPADKSALVAAQRTWIAYRDAESKLISTMAKTEYSGGGSIQSNIANGAYAELVITRTLKIFHYYDIVMRSK